MAHDQTEEGTVPDPAERPLTIVFAGDSVTDCGRREDPAGLGSGYVRRLAHRPELVGWTVLNRGVGGDRTADLRGRWHDDVVDERPDAVSILVGINDTWRRYDSDDPTPLGDFERSYRAILAATVATGAALVLVEPFLVPVSDEQAAWREDLDPKIEVVRGLATELGLPLVDADSRFAALAPTFDRGALAPDGVHPSGAGHDLLARLWVTAAAPLLRERAATARGA